MDLAADLQAERARLTEMKGKYSPNHPDVTDPELAEHAVASGQADLVAVGRGMMFNSHWPWLAAARLGASVVAPDQYLRAVPHGMSILERTR